MTRIVLDASAVLALLNGEAGAATVEEALPDAVMSTVNLAEVVSILRDAGMPRDDIADAVDALGIATMAFDDDAAFRAGDLRPLTRRRGLSLGDRACLALALDVAAPVLTTDAAWADLEIGLHIRLIR